ncbi:MAG: hypothetical protein OQL09_02540 [Gammaproteobacteria bacterium]|nr:hypothetical protein [Gammaproteobacteria bacterium]
MMDSISVLDKRFERQGLHAFAFIVLGAVQYIAIQQLPPGSGAIWGLTTAEWVIICWIFAGLFQGWVVFFWRMELYGGWISANFGKAGFFIHQIGYGVLGFIRFALLIPICLSTKNTLLISPLVSLVIIVLSTPLILWALYSAIFHFGFTRASGADHFDSTYRERKFENKGLYKYVPNVMYTVALFGLYHAGLFWFSTLGLIVAAAHHAFVWAHFYCTEQLDMREIYGVKLTD